ncbi:MAG: NAD-dependent epimerase/dehydratase family protein [Chloroflexi bacterium]|nr:NAD-dependent epimerase/dehydratase family protein [Chloroflexota bacterium]
MTVAVTGAAGFLGRSVVAALRDDPAVDRVVAVDRISGDRKGVEWLLADIRDRALGEKLRGVDVVVHLAAVVLGDMRTAEAVNVGGTANVAEAAATAGCRRFVHASSVAAYGFGVAGRLLTEEDPLRPLDSFPYSRTKGAAERALDEIEKRHPQLAVIRLRPSIILGPNTHEMAARLAGRLSVRPGRNASAAQYVHIDDGVEAFRLATLSDATGAFNISPSDTVTYRELADIAGSRLVTVPAGLARFATRMAEKYRPKMGVDPGWVIIAQRPPLVSGEKAERVLGWTPKYSGRETVEEFVRTIRGGRS